jgi:hypothetical protein
MAAAVRAQMMLVVVPQHPAVIASVRMRTTMRRPLMRAFATVAPVRVWLQVPPAPHHPGRNASEKECGKASPVEVIVKAAPKDLYLRSCDLSLHVSPSCRLR